MFTLVPIRPRSRAERRSLTKDFISRPAGVSLRPPLAFNARPRRLSTPPDAFELHSDIRSYGTTLSRAVGDGALRRRNRRWVLAPRARARLPAPRSRLRELDLLPLRRLRELRVVPYERMSGWSSKASDGVERRRGRVLKARDERRDAQGKVLKKRRSPRRRGRMGTSVRQNAPRATRRPRTAPCPRSATASSVA